MSLRKNHWFPREWVLARSDRNDVIPLNERLRRIAKLNNPPDPMALHQARTPDGSRINYSGLCPPKDEIRLRMREVNTMRVAVTKEAKRRGEAGLDKAELTALDLFLQKRYKMLRMEQQRLNDPKAPIRYRYLAPGDY